MKRGLFLIAFLFLTLSSVSVSAAVVINEIELNPAGTDAGNEWVELYNSGTSVNLSGWYLTDKDNDKFYFPPDIIENFYVLNNLNGLVNSNENVSLFNNFNILQDTIFFINDTSNNANTWQRIPDSSQNLVFQAGTKGFPNLLNLIENKSSLPKCIIKENLVHLSANVTGFCITNVTFSLFLDNEWKNFTGIKINSLYSYIVNTSEFSNKIVNWSVSAIDCFNRTLKDGEESFYVNNKTSLAVNPANPDGINGWYVSEPVFSLSNIDSSKIWYRWDSTGNIEYSSPFGLENIPNPPKLSAGILELNYFSDVCANESEQSRDFKIDLTNPLIKELIPENNSVVVNNLRPTIQAYLDEVYQSNSGIDKTSAVMKVDGVAVSKNVFDADSLDAVVRHNPLIDLTTGKHNVSVYVKDKAGRESELTWFFNISFQVVFNWAINSPENKPHNNPYGARSILFNITPTEKLESISYIDYSEETPRWKNLCKDCKEYGSKREKTKTFSDGLHNITIKAVDYFGQEKSENIVFSIDSKSPKIKKTLPRNGKVINGSDFYIKYTEENLREVLIGWNPVVNLISCNESGQDKECHISLNLSAYDNQYIDYWFNVSDFVRSVQSKVKRVFVDVSSPILTVNLPQNKTGNLSYGRRVFFNLSISEEVKLEYYDKNELEPRWRSLCYRCNSYEDNKAFSRGYHDILILATDKAGNTDVEERVFNVNY